jgi:protein tyrosine phosphatase
LIILQNKINDYQLSFGQMEENLNKNRTQAILPFNPCRVILSTERKQAGGEYINASYMHVSIRRFLGFEMIYRTMFLGLSSG